MRFVPNPKRTGWAVFGFTDGIFHSLRYALENLDFDYLQLLSPTCLPIKPLESFEAHVSGPADAHFDCIDLLRDRDALMSVGYRAFTPEKSFRHRVARRLSRRLFRSRARPAGRSRHLAAQRRRPRRACRGSRSRASRRCAGRRLAATSSTIRFARTAARPGSVRAGRSSVAWWRSFHAPWCATTSAVCASPMSCLIPSLLMHLGIRKGPMNHFIQPFDQAHTGEIHEEAYRQLRGSVHFSPASSRTIRRQPFACGYCGNWPIWTSRRNPIRLRPHSGPR